MLCNEYSSKDLEIFVVEYVSWWEKVRNRLDKYHKGVGQFILDSINENDSPNSIHECFEHCSKLFGSFDKIRKYKIDIAKIIFRKLASWMDLFDCLESIAK